MVQAPIPEAEVLAYLVRQALSVYMTELGPVLSRLGLSQYLQSFVEEGFDTWETVLEITESDL